MVTLSNGALTSAGARLHAEHHGRQHGDLGKSGQIASSPRRARSRVHGNTAHHQPFLRGLPVPPRQSEENFCTRHPPDTITPGWSHRTPDAIRVRTTLFGSTRTQGPHPCLGWDGRNSFCWGTCMKGSTYFRHAFLCPRSHLRHLVTRHPRALRAVCASDALLVTLLHGLTRVPRLPVARR